MINKDYSQLLQTLRDEFFVKLNDTDSLIARTAKFPSVAKKIKVAVGMRRVGKTTLIIQEIKHLIKCGVPWSKILYVNFEDDRLLPMSQQELAALIDAFYALHPENHKEKCYLFFDEIQNVTDWPLVIRRFHDTKNVEMYLTGSSAKLLSKEIASSLRGRSLAVEVWPFSFYEYLSAFGVHFDSGVKSNRVMDELKDHFMRYIISGGFPETLNLHFFDQQRILQEYVQVVTLRDIIERHQVTNEALIKYLIKYFLQNSSSLFSINKIYNDLKSQGYKISRDTLYNYFNYIEDAYLCFGVHVYTDSLRKQQSNPRKIYAVDTGLIRAYSFTDKANLGRLFENMIYLDLRRQGYQVSYYSTNERYEVDFLATSVTGETRLLQVAWTIEDEATLAREERALSLAKNETGFAGEIITLNRYLNHDWLW